MMYHHTPATALAVLLSTGAIHFAAAATGSCHNGNNCQRGMCKQYTGEVD